MSNGAHYRAKGERLRAGRIRRMRTLKQLAAETGVSYTQISRIETGHSTMPRFDAITRLADVLGVEPTYLIEVDEPE